MLKFMLYNLVIYDNNTDQGLSISMAEWILKIGVNILPDGHVIYSSSGSQFIGIGIPMRNLVIIRDPLPQ